jgi:hypothetical protein
MHNAGLTTISRPRSRKLLHCFPNSKHVFVADFFDVFFGIASFQKLCNQVWKHRNVLQSGGKGISHSVKVRTQTHIVYSHQIFHMINVVSNFLHRRERIICCGIFCDVGLCGRVTSLQVIFRQPIHNMLQHFGPACCIGRVDKAPSEINHHHPAIFGHRLDQFITHISLKTRGKFSNRRVGGDHRHFGDS